MSIFEIDHPRAASGEFTTKPQSAPETALAPERFTFVGSETLTASAAVTLDRVRTQVSFRYGERELDDEIAIAGARHLAELYDVDGAPSAFAELAATGATEKDAIGREIGRTYGSAEYRDRPLMDMLGTWALDKQRDY